MPIALSWTTQAVDVSSVGSGHDLKIRQRRERLRYKLFQCNAMTHPFYICIQFRNWQIQNEGYNFSTTDKMHSKLQLGDFFTQFKKCIPQSTYLVTQPLIRMDDTTISLRCTQLSLKILILFLYNTASCKQYMIVIIIHRAKISTMSCTFALKGE